MDINNFVLPKNALQNKFKYGIKFIPEKALNKYSHYMIVVVKSSLKGQGLYNICFKKNKNFNNYELNQNEFEEYINFLKSFHSHFQNKKRISEEFFIKDKKQYITLSTLNDNYIKLCTEKEYENIKKRIFFVISKIELFQYINSLNAIYAELKMSKKLCNINNYFLVKKEKNKLYLNTLYILADEALDRKDRETFYMISREIQKYIH
ncbi:hypothetical protein [Clostridium rectalis]|uniref:hypothetical protein n=1 Tax=Clostridium rectalis TaxID=2040295 RepID=UPI000F6368E6|nr:hypothetical protein [Clostridium rectalis]